MTQAYDSSRYLSMIDAILSVADLDEISVKRIRNALQELFDVDLNPHKDEMNELIVQRYYKLADEKAVREEREKNDHIMALKLQNEDSKSRVTRRGTTTPKSAPTKVTKRRTTGGPRGGPNNAFNAELLLSPQLQDVLGSSHLSRPQVVKQMWVYIRAHGLQSAKDGRKIDCDEKLRMVFKKSSVTMFEMNKLLSDHLYKEEDISMRSGTDFDEKPPSRTPVKKERGNADVSSEISDVED